MRVQISWVSDLNGQQKEIIESFTTQGAEQQIRSEYRDVTGFRINGISVLKDLPRVRESSSEPRYYSDEHSGDYDSGSDSPAVVIGAMFMVAGAVSILIGLFTLPSGLFFIGLGVFLIWFPLYAIEHW